MLKKNMVISLVIVLVVSFGILIWFYNRNPSMAGKRIVANKKTEEKENMETITFVKGKDLNDVNKTLIDKFEKIYPNIKVDFEELPTSTDDQHNILAAKFSAESSNYDVISMDLVWTAEFAEEGWLEPLKEYFPKDEWKNYFDWAVKSVTYKDDIYGVPKGADAGVLYYRKDLLAKAPKSWDELMNMCNRYVGKNGIKYGIVFQGEQYEGLVCNAVEFIGSNGGSILDDGRVRINTPQSIGGLKLMRKLVRDKYTPHEITSYQENDATAKFLEGKTLFMRNWPSAWVILNTDRNSKVKGKVGIVKIPKGRNGRYGISCLGGWNLGINKYSKHKEAAVKLIKFLTSEEEQKINAVKAGVLPTRMKLYKDKDILRSNPYWYNFYDILKTAIPRPVSPFYPSISDVLQINIHKVISGETTPQNAAKDMEEGLLKILHKK